MNRHNDQSSSAPTPEPCRASASTAWAFGPRDWLFALALFVAVFLVYQPAWQGGLVWDDESHVTRPELQSGAGLYRIWFDVGATLQYYPLLHSAFWVEHKLWGDATFGYHLVNILLHGTVALMAALALRRLKIPGAYLAAAIFALHPIQVESVAWITEQKNTLSALFYLGAMLAYLHFDQTRKASLYCSALGLFVLGVLSKTIIATLPGALLVIFWWQRGRLSWKNDVLPLVPFFLLGAGGGMITAWWELQINNCVGPDFTLTLVERFLIAGRTAWFLLWKLLWPTQLTFMYPRWQISAGVWWQYAFPLGAAAMLAALWSIRRWARAPLAAALFFGGTLFPMLGFFNLYTFRYSFVANHYQYLAGLGIITLVAAGAALLLTRWGLWDRPGGYALCLIPLAGLAGLTRHDSRMYADIDTLFQTTLEQNPDCWMAHNDLGTILLARGKVDEAIAHFQEGLELKPQDSDLRYNLANALDRKGQFDEAIASYQKALKIKPDLANAHNNLGIDLGKRGEMDEAVAHFQKALKIRPGYAEARNNLGIARFQRDKIREKLAERRDMLGSRPDDVALLNETAWMLATNPNASIRSGTEAIELAERAVQLSKEQEPAVLGTLAAAYAEAGRFAEAVKTAEQALTLAISQDNAALADALETQIKLYRADSAYRELRQASPPPSGRESK
jgi:protein O-mannosyl-transferase